tara:strand:- start:8471 stop:11446 length:2976 start_codon:yes stop_codon:yes gene_type:complete
MNDDVTDGDVWTLQHLFYGERAEDEVPEVGDVRRLLGEYRQTWCMRDVTPQTVGSRIFELLNIPIDTAGLTWNHIMQQFGKDYIRWRKLERWTRDYGIDSEGEIRNQLRDVMQTYQMAKQFLITNNTLCVRMRNGIPGAESVLPEGEATDVMGGQTLMDAGEAKLNSWQDSFLKLRSVLAGENFRRAGKNFLARKVTASNLETQAFEVTISIVEYIDDNNRYDDNFAAWLAHTASGGNQDQMVKYLTERPIAEAPDIEENCHLRSYEGDALGRGAVIYDAATDMAWPYAMKSVWSIMEARVNKIRRLVYQDEKHLVTAPTSEDVCVVHLNAAFWYDTFAEAEELVQGNELCFLQRAWYEAEAFECYGEKYRLDDYRLAAYMQRSFSGDADDGEPGAWGRSWQRAAGEYHLIGGLWKRCKDDVLNKGTEIFCDALTDALATRLEFNEAEVDFFRAMTDIPQNAFIRTGPNEHYRQVGTLMKLSTRDNDAFTKIERFPLSDEFLRENVLDDVVVTGSHCIKNSDGQTWVPLYSRGCMRRYRMDMDTWVALGGTEERIHHRSFVFVKPYTGQRWRQVAAIPDGFELLSVSNDIGDTLRANLYKSETCLSEDMAATLTLTPTSYVRVHDLLLVPVFDDGFTRGRYMRVHTGRNWRDCSTLQFDKIYDSQSFCTHDKFMLWGQKGRTLFTVHEFDTYQTTFIIIGYGGTGKSTIMLVMQKLWPTHLRGILSSNIEQKFGMSQVLNRGKARVIYCNEVSEDLQLVQEEWQTSCSGEEGSFAVKHESPWVGTCKAHHFWVGNAFPKHWKNNNNQVSRRLCGVLMDTPIQPRDGNVMEEIDRIMDVVQRKMVLAYFDMVDQYGTIDPMSRIERLPPAFATFYNTGRGLSNPVMMFIDESLGVKFDIFIGVHPQRGRLIMETHAFRDEYIAWRATRNDLPRLPNISADKYLPPLRELNVQEMSKVRIRIPDGNNDYIVKNTSILCGIALCGVDIPELCYD